jgi:hypothetical protein
MKPTIFFAMTALLRVQTPVITTISQLLVRSAQFAQFVDPGAVAGQR